MLQHRDGLRWKAPCQRQRVPKHNEHCSTRHGVQKGIFSVHGCMGVPAHAHAVAAQAMAAAQHTHTSLCHQRYVHATVTEPLVSSSVWHSFGTSHAQTHHGCQPCRRCVAAACPTSRHFCSSPPHGRICNRLSGLCRPVSTACQKGFRVAVDARVELTWWWRAQCSFSVCQHGSPHTQPVTRVVQACQYCLSAWHGTQLGSVEVDKRAARHCCWRNRPPDPCCM